MESKANYTLVGLVVLILTAALLSVALWFSVGFNQKSYKVYTVYMHESVSGLSDDAPVKYNGVKIGFVKKIKLNLNDPRQVELLLSIEDDVPITTSTFATLISQGITGVNYVGLSAASSDLTPLHRMPGEPYPVIPARPSLLNQLDSILKDVAENINKVSTQTQRIFSEKNARYLTNLLDNADKVTATVAKNKAEIDRSLKNANVFLANMARVSKDMPTIVSELKIGVKKFTALADTMSTAGHDVSKTMTAGRDTLDKISQQTLPPAILLLRRLNAISANLEQISSDMRQNPAIIVRGKTPPKPGPGE